MSVKILAFSMVMLPLSIGVLATGILFGSYYVAVVHNPEGGERLRAAALAKFAFIWVVAFCVAALVFEHTKKYHYILYFSLTSTSIS